MSCYKYSLIAILIIFATAVGCAGGNNPVAPVGDVPPVADAHQASQSGNDWLMGYYDAIFDPESGTLEIVGNRTVDFTLNILPFLNQMTVPPNGISIGSLVVHDDDPTFLGIDVELSIHHPFPGYDQYTAYDLRTVVIGNGAQTMEYNSLRTEEHGTDLWLKNADGYSRWFNPTDFTTPLIFGYAPGGFQNLAGDSQVNPYKYYSKHLGKDDNLWSYLTENENFDGVFESGSGRTFEIEFPLPPAGIGLMFGLAVVVAWEEQGPTGPYHPYHVTEAVATKIVQTPNAWYDGTSSGGNLILDVDLFAWEYQPSTIRLESSVLSGIESFDADSLGEPAGDHVSTYHFDIPATTLETTEGHYCWVIAEYGTSDYSNGLPDIPHADGPLAAFFRTDILIDTSPSTEPPIIDAIDPDFGVLDMIVDPLTITGQNFDPDAEVTFEKSGGGTPIDATGENVAPDGMSLTCAIDLDSAVFEAGLYDVTVTNPSSGYLDTLIDGFQVYIGAEDVTGNLVLAIGRYTNLGIGEIQLDWTENTNNSPFYAVYADENPYDGLDPDVFVTEVSAETAAIDQTVWPGLSTDGAYAFGIKGRTLSGVAETESINFSEPAFVEMEDFDGGDNPEPWIQGYLNVNFKWEEQTGGLIDGSTSIRHNPYCEASMWAVLASQVIPSIPDSAMSFIEFAHIASYITTEGSYKAYMAGHTRTGAAPPIGTTNYIEFDNWDYNSVMDGTFNYQNTSPGSGIIALNDRFGYEYPNIERGWQFRFGPKGTAQLTRISKPYYITHAGNTRAGIGWARWSGWIYHTDWAEVDEIAVVIY